MHAAIEAEKRVGIVSNNAGAAVERFLARVGLAGQVWPVIGRAYRMPYRMKPHPWPLTTALDALAVRPEAAVFIGDSETDIQVSQNCGVPCIAYANKNGKRERFEAAGAVVVDSMWEIHAAIQAHVSTAEGDARR